MSAPTEALGLVPNYDRRPRERFDIRPHGTEARATRHRRRGEKPCPACLRAENAAHAYRRAAAAAVAGSTTNRAACQAADPGLFFPDLGDAAAEAKAIAICAGCPARAACYAGAVERGERWGIWGGSNFETVRPPVDNAGDHRPEGRPSAP